MKTMGLESLLSKDGQIKAVDVKGAFADQGESKKETQEGQQ
ncbi:MAG: hypothetical protein NUV91_06570 [Candidatus Omnitrophica bacterium]|nr:hypothetical protein [Candidatus Omnitrophota bacterium]